MTRRPNGASARRHASKDSPPLISSTTSTGSPSFASRIAASRSSARESIAASAPSRRASSRFSSDEASPITRPAPIRFASCTASEPVPPAAAWTTTDSPSWSRAEIRSRLRAVRPCSSSAGGLLVGDLVGDRHQDGLVTATFWA